MLRPFRELDLPVDVDSSPAGGFELPVQSQARGHADACFQQLVVTAELREPGSRFEGAQDLISRVVQLVLIELVHPGGVATVGTLVQDDRAFADELYAEGVEVLRPLVESFAERFPDEV